MNQYFTGMFVSQLMEQHENAGELSFQGHRIFCSENTAEPQTIFL